MSAALSSFCLPLLAALAIVLVRRRACSITLVATALSFGAAVLALEQVVTGGAIILKVGGWPVPLAIRLELAPLRALLLAFTALIHFLVALHALRHRHQLNGDYWHLSCFLHAALAGIWLAADIFNFYVLLELLTLTAVALVSLAGPKAYRPALNYLLLSLAASLCYLLGVAILYGRYGMLDIPVLGELAVDDHATRFALLLMTLGLMLKAALWPLHAWLPPAHAAAPTPVSALLSALVVKAPLFILWLLWSEVAPTEFARQMGLWLAGAGICALISGGWSAFRAPHLKTLVAFSTVAQLGYALLALGSLLFWQQPGMHVALWLFVLAHGLAKVSMFLAAGEMLITLGTRRVAGLKGATQTMPIAMFAFAVAGGSLIGLPPSGGFLAKWVLLQPLLAEPARWAWALGLLLGTLVSAAYVFRVITLAFDRADPNHPNYRPDKIAQWLAMVPALLVWAMALVADNVIFWLTGMTQ